MNTLSVETKFKPGDKVWVLENNQAVEKEIARTEVTYILHGRKKDEITPVVIHRTGLAFIGSGFNMIAIPGSCGDYLEKHCFATKEELIASL